MSRLHIAAVIPAFNAAARIGAVLHTIPDLISTVIVVDDGSSDNTAAVVEEYARTDRRIELIRHARNGGVGAAMVTGFRRALELEAAIVVKIDADGQMPLGFVSRLVQPLISGDADYVKGNRFRHVHTMQKMPALRRLGNVALSFLAKAATGYWHCFDPTNGFVAIRGDVLANMPLHRIDPTFFFEISMLFHLYLLGAVVKEEPMPVRYDGEPSTLSIPRVLVGFPGRLLRALARRIVFKNFVYDFTIGSLHLVAGLPLLLAGMLYGGYKWYWYASRARAAPTGTVVLSALFIIMGFQLILSAISFDLQAVPRVPINTGALELDVSAESVDRRTAPPRP